jgi:DNA-binding MarR family transcriptional regulator
MPGLSHADYVNLLRFRTALRRFDSWSREQAQHVGLTHAQHQLLLAVKGHDQPEGPTIGEAASYLNTRHHSVVGLVDRVERAGLIHRVRDAEDARVVRLHLTELGEQSPGPRPPAPAAVGTDRTVDEPLRRSGVSLRCAFFA